MHRLAFRLAIALAIAGCSRDKSSKPAGGGSGSGGSGSAAPDVPKFSMRHTQPITVSVADAPIALEKMQLTPTAYVDDKTGKVVHDVGSFSIRYSVVARDVPDGSKIGSAITCRLGDRNITDVKSVDDEIESSRTTELSHPWNPSPLAIVPSACLIEIRLADKLVATACYRDNKIVDGACPDDALPAPTPVAGMAIGLTDADVSANDASATVGARVFAVALTPIPDGRRVVARYQCEALGGFAYGEDDMAFLRLDKIPTGRWMRGLTSSFLDQIPSVPVRCQVRFVTRPVDKDGDVALIKGSASGRAFANDKPLDTWCIASDKPPAHGPCAPKLAPR
jgi:hypothetical protein